MLSPSYSLPMNGVSDNPLGQGLVNT
uniref:Transposase n=1 Tax=Strongyloides papillosus TaxID=174720 RepID=A0A0N5C724_STREA